MIPTAWIFSTVKLEAASINSTVALTMPGSSPAPIFLLNEGFRHRFAHLPVCKWLSVEPQRCKAGSKLRGKAP